MAGTNPRDGGSFLAVDTDLTDVAVILRFAAMPGKTYSIQYRDDVETGDWQRVRDVDLDPNPRTVSVEIQNTPGRLTRFYRLVTPRL